MSDANLLKLIKRAVELCRPDLRSDYRVTRKAKVVTAYASDGQYFADVQPLRNDRGTARSGSSRIIVLRSVEIPIMWGGPNRGVDLSAAGGYAVRPLVLRWRPQLSEDRRLSAGKGTALQAVS